MEAKQKKLTTKRQSLISDTVAASTAVEFGSVEAEAQQFANVVMDGRRIVESISSWKEVLCLLCSQGWCFRDIVKARVKGLACVWIVRCPTCLMEKDVNTLAV